MPLEKRFLINNSPEWWWLEAGSSDDLMIYNNTISDCYETSINITAHAGSGGAAPAGAHKRIMLLNSTIQTARLPAVRVTSLEDGSINNNTITTTVAGEVIAFENNNDVEVRDNNITQPESK